MALRGIVCNKPACFCIQVDQAELISSRVRQQVIFSYKNVAISAIILFLALEVTVRVSGLSDFPLYDVNESIGYVIKPSQSGSFLHMNSWVFNDRSMGTEMKWNPSVQPNIMLIGNSIVMGGNPYDQTEKLASQLQRDIGPETTVWTIAVGGWTNVNEIVYLNQNPDVVQSTGFFMWEYMAGGLSELSRGGDEYAFPQKYPICASCYVLRRYLPQLFFRTVNELPPTGRADTANLAKFDAALSALARAAKSKNRGFIFLYPTKKQYMKAKSGEDWLPERSYINNTASRYGITVVDIANSSRWNEKFYRNDGVHPTVQGNTVLAEILAEQFQILSHDTK